MIWTMVEMPGLVHDVIHGIHGDALHIGDAWWLISLSIRFFLHS